MRVTITCPACDGEQAADIAFDLGGSYGQLSEHITDIEWDRPTEPTDCYCERDGAAEQRLIDAANEPRDY